MNYAWMLGMLAFIGLINTGCKTPKPIPSSGWTTPIVETINFRIPGAEYRDGDCVGSFLVDITEMDIPYPDRIGLLTEVRLFEVIVTVHHEKGVVERVGVRSPDTFVTPLFETERNNYPSGGAEPNCDDDLDAAYVEKESGPGSNTTFNVDFVATGAAASYLAGVWTVEILDRLSGGTCGTEADWNKASCSDIEEVDVTVRFRYDAPATSLPPE